MSHYSLFTIHHSESVFPISSCKPSLVGVLTRQIVKGGRCVFACWPFQSKASLSLSFLATALPLGSAGGFLREQASLLITTLCEFIIFAENCSWLTHSISRSKTKTQEVLSSASKLSYFKAYLLQSLSSSLLPVDQVSLSLSLLRSLFTTTFSTELSQGCVRVPKTTAYSR